MRAGNSWLTLLSVLVLALSLAACGSRDATEEDDSGIKFTGSDAEADLGLDADDEDVVPDVGFDDAAEDIEPDEEEPEEIEGPDPCDPNPCDESPAHECQDDDTLLIYPTPGNCVAEAGQAVCDYAPNAFDCTEFGKQCIDAQCQIPPTACYPANPCTAAPESVCEDDGVTLTAYDPLGECTLDGEDAVCEYPPMTIDCSEDGNICFEGECMEPFDPCDPNPCIEIPTATCSEDGVTLIEYDDGVCTPDGFQHSCEYPELPELCPDDGVCVGGVCGPVGMGNLPDEPGQLVVTEFMAKAQAGSDSAEWVEIYNASNEHLDLNGCHFKDDDNDDHIVEQVLVIAPESYLLAGRSADPEVTYGLVPGYVYSGFSLSNDVDEIVIECDAIEIDRVNYVEPQVVLGVASQLDPEQLNADGNDLLENWCAATEYYDESSEKLGTPGAANSPCVPPDPCDPNPCTEPPPTECADDFFLNTFDPQGECEGVDGLPVCTYTPVPFDCQELEMVCVDAECVVPPDPCDPNPCLDPPAAECSEDGLTLTSHESPGACSEGEGAVLCDYTPVVTECWADGMECKDGACVQPGQGVMPSELGDIIVTEFMAKSQGGSSDYGEWVELFNTTESPLDLDGCELKDDDSNNFLITGTFVVNSGQHVVFARSDVPEENHGLVPDMVYADFALSNSADEIVLVCDALEIDRVDYSGSFVAEGVSSQLDLSAYDGQSNDVPENWCLAIAGYGDAGKLGTPGAENLDCTGVEDPCLPNPCTEPPVNVCAEDGITLLSYPATGACAIVEEAAECTYEETSTDCSLDEGIVCKNAACVPENSVPQPTAEGQFVITEFMARSQSGTDQGEWVELVNTAGEPLDLGGCMLKDDDNDDHIIVGSLLVQDGEHVVLARSGDPVANHGLPESAYVYSGFSLSNTEDEIELKCGEVTIDKVMFTAAWVVMGVAIALDPDMTDPLLNDDLANWCEAADTYGTADKKGTPGAANAECPEPPAVDWCRLQWPLEETVQPGQLIASYGRVFAEGITDLTDGVDPDAMLVGEVGVGPDQSLPEGNVDWTWTTAAGTPDWSALAANEVGNDEYTAELPAPMEQGQYDFAFRFSLDGGATWTYCDKAAGFEHDGSEDDYQTENAGALTVVTEQ